MKIKIKSVKLKSGVVPYLDAGKGETILFLHGAGGRPPEGASFVPMLAAAHRILVPSRPGFDDTPLGEAATPRAAAEVMADFVKRVAKGPVHIVGQSAGAAVACWLAVLHPDLMKTLVLSAPAAFEVRPAAGDGGPPSPEEIEHRLYGETPSWSQPPSQEERARIQKNAAGYMQRARALPHGNADLLERLGEVSAPTLVLWATADRLLMPESAEPYQKKIKRCYRILVYGAAHELPISAADRWVSLIGDFVARGEGFVVAQSPA